MLLWQWNSNIDIISRELPNLSSSCVLPEVPLVVHLVQQVEHISSLNGRQAHEYLQKQAAYIDLPYVLP